ncbi:hypothetical protein GGS24DRAFT_170399 [Hypoxylon argillaceum]|nr:hypothetical protein GGS24DRAFT_170399 [Hypoxylon argillaceum]
MAFDANAYWGSSEIDVLRCPTPPALGLINNPPTWDGLFDFKEPVDPNSTFDGSLDLLQDPLPCSYEPPDEWLIEFERLQEVHSRAPAMGGPGIPGAPTHHNTPYTFTGGKIADGKTSDGSRHQGEEKIPAPFLHDYRDPFLKPEGRAFVQGGETNYTVPTPTTYMREIDSQSSGCPGPAMRPPMPYGWNSTPTFDSQPAPSVHDVEKTMRELREMEQSFQADTKRRMTQVKQSRPG